MKKFLKVVFVVMILLATMVLLTGCGSEDKDGKDSVKKEELTFDGEEGTITFKVPAGKGYKISTDDEDLRTSREQGALVGKEFKIGIEFCDDYNYFFDSDLEKMKEARQDYDDYKEVKYGGVEGVQYFYGGYMCYDIMLPVENNEKYYLALTVYGPEDNEESAKKAIANKELLEILDSIKFEAK